ncbi:MAG: fumarate reductase cytochrome b subunit [Campylobacteraceae bacterium]|jgi:fumarate reductase subunit C|nr:fumarate reductase cytochrome b subunit [Campylobacteraceae bacterium]
MDNIIEGYLGKRVDGKKSRLPAKLDFIQSATGLFLGLFMWGHMFFVATILIDKDVFNWVAGVFEGSLFLSEKQPIIVSVIVFIVFCIFVVHACLGMRKLPINFRQYQIYKAHASYMKHSDTSLWFWQAKTGFIMFFLGSAHLIIMMTNPAITAEISGGRMYSHFMWPFYLILLFAVELHGGIGLYRLCVKWGWFEGKDARVTRKRLTKLKWSLTVFFLALGLATLAVYVKVGYEYAPKNSHAQHVENVIQQIDINADKARI